MKWPKKAAPQEQNQKLSTKKKDIRSVKNIWKIISETLLKSLTNLSKIIYNQTRAV